MSSSRLSREPPEKTFCVSAACATLCTPQRKGCDENSCCCTRPQSTKSEETWFYSNVPHSCMRCCWAGVTCCISRIKVSEVSLDCLYNQTAHGLHTFLATAALMTQALWPLPEEFCCLAELPLLWTPWKQGPRLTSSPCNASPARPTCRNHLRKGSLLL